MRTLVHTAIDFVLPPVCLLCRLPATAAGFCAGCRADLPVIASPCPSCAAPVRDTDLPCGRCQRAPPPFERLLAPFAYRFPLDLAITRLKYARELAFAAPIGRLMSEAIVAAGPAIDIVVPVPLHWRRLLLRGFNQAERLATGVARSLGCPLAARALDRPVPTRTQTALDRSARQRNVATAFRASRAQVRSRRVLLVDDVVTSGATAEAASRALLRAGAASVVVLAAARA